MVVAERFIAGLVRFMEESGFYIWLDMVYAGMKIPETQAPYAVPP